MQPNHDFVAVQRVGVVIYAVETQSLVPIVVEPLTLYRWGLNFTGDRFHIWIRFRAEAFRDITKHTGNETGK